MINFMPVKKQLDPEKFEYNGILDKEYNLGEIIKDIMVFRGHSDYGMFDVKYRNNDYTFNYISGSVRIPDDVNDLLENKINSVKALSIKSSNNYSTNRTGIRMDYIINII